MYGGTCTCTTVCRETRDHHLLLLTSPPEGNLGTYCSGTRAQCGKSWSSNQTCQTSFLHHFPLLSHPTIFLTKCMSLVTVCRSRGIGLTGDLLAGNNGPCYDWRPKCFTKKRRLSASLVLHTHNRPGKSSQVSCIANTNANQTTPTES